MFTGKVPSRNRRSSVYNAARGSRRTLEAPARVPSLAGRRWHRSCAGAATMLILRLAAMLALQQQPALAADSTYETPGLAALVARAASANAAPPSDLTGYRARIETELSFVRLEPDGRET